MRVSRLLLVTALCAPTALAALAPISAANAVGCTKAAVVQSGHWSDPNSWSPTGVPGASDDVCINASLFDGDWSSPVHSLTIGYGAYGSLDLAVGSVEVAPSITVYFGTLQFHGGSPGVASPVTDLLVNGGNVSLGSTVPLVFGTIDNREVLILNAPGAPITVDNFIESYYSLIDVLANGSATVGQLLINNSAVSDGEFDFTHQPGTGYKPGATYPAYTLGGTATSSGAFRVVQSQRITGAGRYANPVISASGGLWKIVVAKASLSPKVVARGALLTVSGSAWPANQTIDLQVRYAGDHLRSVGAVFSGSGSWTTSFTVDPMAATGTAYLMLTTRMLQTSKSIKFAVT